MYEVRTITLPLPLRMGSVNSYLIRTGRRFVLLDTGPSSQRARLERELVRAGCEPEQLDLIILTHGDFDHTGNAAYLRHKFATQIAMHVSDWGMAEQGDMFWNRESGNVVLRSVSPVLFRFNRRDRFRPDLELDDGHDLSGVGVDARVVSIPGHSAGSIGILTAGGDLFCGDLLENRELPTFNSIMDNPAAARASVEKLKSLGVGMVYPGHGLPFSFAAFAEGL